MKLAAKNKKQNRNFALRNATEEDVQEEEKKGPAVASSEEEEVKK